MKRSPFKPKIPPRAPNAREGEFASFKPRARKPAEPITGLVTSLGEIFGLQARAALAGFELLPSEVDGYVISRWGLTLWRADLAAVEEFLARVEGKSGAR